MSRRFTANFAVLVIAAGLVAAVPTDVAAQTKPITKPAAKRAREFLIGGIYAGPTAVGSSAAILPDGAGNTGVTLFSAKNKVRGYGFEANIGAQLRKSLWFEVTGGWTRLSLNSQIRNDFENAGDSTVSLPMSRFLVEGAVLRYFHGKGPSSWFVRAGAGWMREIAGGATLTGDGVIGGAGLGYRRWWRTNGKGSVKRMGLRLEGRADVRNGGISIGEKGIHFGPSGAAHLVFGF